MLVQYIAIAILFVLTVYAFCNLKKAILLWLPFKLLFNNQIAVRYSSPGMALVIAGDIMLFAAFFLQRKKRANFYNGSFIFKNPATLIGLSYLLSLLFTIAPFQTAAIATFKYFISGFGVLYLAHRALKDVADVQFFIKGCVIVSILIVLLAISENVLRTNLWLDFVFFNSPFDPEAGRMFYLPGQLEMRYGMVRSRSFFSFHVPFGYACCCLYWLLFYFYKNAQLYKSPLLLMITSILLIGGVIMSNSKQAYLGLFIMILSLYPLKTVFNIRIILPVALAFSILLIYFPEYLNNILSLTDEDLAEEGKGSTVAMRQEQYESALRMFFQSPLLGNGISSIGILKSHGFGAIRGAESSWLEILPERGLIGAFSYLYMYIKLWKMKNIMGKKMLAFFLLSIFVMETAGGIKDISIWGLCLLAVFRYNQLLRLSVKNYNIVKKE